MQDSIMWDSDAAKIFVFDQVYPLSAASEQAKQKKLGAFGLVAKINPFKRPKDETVLLAKHELRYEPFWHVVARREVDFTREINYPVEIGNVHAFQVTIGGQVYPITTQGKRRSITLAAVEACRRRIDHESHLDALNREAKKGSLENYIARYRVQEQQQLDLPEAVLLQVRVPMLLQKVRQMLSAEVINAHEVLSDTFVVEKAHLYYRPVFAFEFVWTTEDKVGVIEVDGLTGEVVENGQWFKDKVGCIVSRDMLFEAGAEVAGALVPGAGLAVKVIERMTAPTPQRPAP